MEMLTSVVNSMSEGLAETFCLSDPARHDNPILFASEGESVCFQPVYDLTGS